MGKLDSLGRQTQIRSGQGRQVTCRGNSPRYCMAVAPQRHNRGDMGMLAWACSVSYTGNVQQRHGRAYGGINGTVICQRYNEQSYQQHLASRNGRSAPRRNTVAVTPPLFHTIFALLLSGSRLLPPFTISGATQVSSNPPIVRGLAVPVTTHVASCLILASFSAII
jgi:hypothetical protein